MTSQKRDILELDDDNLSEILSRSPTPDGQYDESIPTDQVTPAGMPDWGPVVSCLWDDCFIVFGDQHLLIEHITNDHIGQRPNGKYTCEWQSCSRKGKNQSSRFALIAHLRSHTTDKPFICQEKAECDRSFTRSDALAKHMKMQHHVETLPSGKTVPLPPGERKKKQKLEDGTPEDSQDITEPDQSVKEEENAYIDLIDESIFQSIPDDPNQPFYLPQYTYASAQYHLIEENNEILKQHLDYESQTLEKLDKENDKLLSELMSIEVNEKTSNDFFKELTLKNTKKSLKSNNNHYRSGAHVVYHEIQTEEID